MSSRPTPRNDTTRATVPVLLRSNRNSLTTTTAIREAPPTHTIRRAKRLPTSIPVRPVRPQTMDRDAWRVVDKVIDSKSNGTPTQW